jgi:hypothetical protein
MTLLLSGPTLAQKPPQVIRERLLSQIEVSTELFRAEAANELLTEPLWWVGITNTAGSGKNYRIMTVKDGEVLRLYRHGLPESRDGILRLLPAEFRVQSEADARRLVEAAVALNVDPFGNPEEPDVPVAAMRVDHNEGEYFFVDGERFGDATGYRIAVDDSGQIMDFEYSFDLSTAPLEADN